MNTYGFSRTKIFLILLLLTGIGLVTWRLNQERETKTITNYEECVAAGYPIMESYPERCAVPGGETFTRIIKDQLQEELNY